MTMNDEELKAEAARWTGKEPKEMEGWVDVPPGAPESLEQAPNDSTVSKTAIEVHGGPVLINGVDLEKRLRLLLYISIVNFMLGCGAVVLVLSR